MHYRELAGRGSPLPPLSDVEFRCRSQNGEDGILLYIFSLIGTTSKRLVEIGAGDGLECNAANLIINHGWQGLLIDGDPGSVARGRASYSTFTDTWVAPPTFKHAWITMENVDSVVSSEGFAGPIDLLSLDIDGNDYWIWKGLTCIGPRVVVLEFNASCGPDESLAMSYRADFRLDLRQLPTAVARHFQHLPNSPKQKATDWSGSNRWDSTRFSSATAWARSSCRKKLPGNASSRMNA